MWSHANLQIHLPAVHEDNLVDPSQWWYNRSLQRVPNHAKSNQGKYEDPLLAFPYQMWSDKNLWVAGSLPYQPVVSNEVPSRVALDEAYCRKKCMEGDLSEAAEALEILVQRGSQVDRSLFYRVLKKCTAQKNLALGKHVHALTVESGYVSDTFLANHCICMYASHGLLDEAANVFRNVAVPDSYMWASIISAYARHSQPAQAIQLYRQMRVSGAKPDNHIFVAVLKACAVAVDLASGNEVHADILSSGVQPDIFVGNCLVDMYAKCGSVTNSRRIFDNLITRDVVTWNAMISGYTEQGQGKHALALYETMQQGGAILPNKVTFICLLKACSSLRTLHDGEQLHAQIQARGFEADVVIGSSLVDMYAKCGNLKASRLVFDRLPAKDVVTWNCMFGGYIEHELGQEVLTLYESMQKDGTILPDSVTFMYLLKACTSVGALQQGKHLYALIKERGLDSDVAVGNSVVDLFGKCGSLVEARRVFDTLPRRDVVSWNALLNGYAQHSHGRMAIQCFKEMQEHGIQPNEATFTCLLVACTHEGLVTEGQRYFKMMSQNHKIMPTVHHYTCMIDLLGRSGHLEEADSMWRSLPFQNDIVGWTSLLSACKVHGDLSRARLCFERLIELDPKNSTAYVILATMYSTAGMWEDVQIIESLRKSAGAKKKPAKACIEVRDEVHEFTVGEERADVSPKLRNINWRVTNEGGHVPHTELVLRAVPNSQKEDALCGHAEKLALAYGLLHTPDGSPLLVTKNLRMCNDCHSATKVLSRLEKRDIIVRDVCQVHHFVDGCCSCGDAH